MELIKPNINIDFVGKRYLAFLASGLLILMTFVSLFLHGGPNYGIDFAGGTIIQVRFHKDTTPADIKKALEPIGITDATVQSFGKADTREYLIRTQAQTAELEGLDDKVSEALATVYGKDGFEVRRVEMVGPKVGQDLREKALMAIFFSILMIAVYISGRFEQKWILAAVMAAALFMAMFSLESLMASGKSGSAGQGTVYLILVSLLVTVGVCAVLRLRYALGAIVALIHDVLITVGVFSLMNKEFSLATVAAILTIIGYSLNDTIIVFDRIRENLRKAGKRELGKIINDSVNQTLSRTILTSGTTLVVLLSLYLLGGGVIEDFAFALLVGIVVGTYSSIFVASPVLLMLPEGKPSWAMKKATPRPVAPQSRAAATAASEAPAASAASPAAKRKSRSRKKGH